MSAASPSGKRALQGGIAKADFEANPTLKPLLDKRASRLADFPQQPEAWKQREHELLERHDEAVVKVKAAGYDFTHFGSRFSCRCLPLRNW